MNYLTPLFILTLLFMTHSLEAQEGSPKGKGLRNATARGNYQVEVVTIPDNTAASFERLQSKVLLYRPVKKKADKSPLLISLHGFGGGRRDIEMKKWSGEVKQLLKPENTKYESMILVPQSDGEWDPASLNKLLDYIVSQNPDIDVNRIYCKGYSMGGKGTWEWAMHSPKRFAAIMPMGFIPDLSKIKTMVNLPIWAMVGDRDSKPRVSGIPAMEKALKEFGSTKVKTTIFPGANHASSSRLAQEEEGTYQWLFSHSLK